MISKRLDIEQVSKMTSLSAEQLGLPLDEYPGPRRRTNWQGVRYWLEEDVIEWLNKRRRR